MNEEKKMRRWIGSVGLVLLGATLAVGVLSVTRPAPPPPPSGASKPDADVRVWTCSMHPQIRMDKPGKCPICGMDLVPVSTGGGANADHTAHIQSHLALSEHARQMARVETVAVEERLLWKEIRTVGKVALDETAVAYITARVDGRVDEVFANFPGTRVAKDDHLARIYSPDLLTTQEEFLIASRAGGSAVPTRRRLELWGISDEQINELVKSGKSQTDLVIHAPRGGTVIEKNIRAGQYVKTGDALFLIADLSQVWLVIDVYESELSWVRFGEPVQVTLEGQPSAITGTVAFVEPVLNEPTRAVRVRVVLKNESGKLKPGMYAEAVIRVPVMPDGNPGPTGLEGKYACPMHPYVVSDSSGKCSVCGMPLELVPGTIGDGHAPKVLAVPAEAVLTTGQRMLVYVEQTPGEFHLVAPKLGPRAGDFYPVLSGLTAGDRVVARGNFLLDSQFQISGKPSLLYPEGISGGGIGHAGHSVPTQPSSDAKPAANPHAGHGEK